VKFGEPGLDLLPEEAICTSTRTLLASLGVADPEDGGPWGWRAVTGLGWLGALKVMGNATIR